MEERGDKANSNWPPPPVLPAAAVCEVLLLFSLSLDGAAEIPGLLGAAAATVDFHVCANSSHFRWTQVMSSFESPVAGVLAILALVLVPCSAEAILLLVALMVARVSKDCDNRAVRSVQPAALLGVKTADSL